VCLENLESKRFTPRDHFMNLLFVSWKDDRPSAFGGCLTMSEPKERPVRLGSADAVVPQVDASGSNAMSRKRPILTDPVDEILIFSYLKTENGKAPHGGDSTTTK
jgi:hypothetical protein